MVVPNVVGENVGVAISDLQAAGFGLGFKQFNDNNCFYNKFEVIKQSPTAGSAVAAGIKYRVIAQKHTDLRDHFQRLTAQSRQTTTTFADNHDILTRLQHEHAELRTHCDGLEDLLQNYARIINELAQQNADLQEQVTAPQATIP